MTYVAVTPEAFAAMALQAVHEKKGKSKDVGIYEKRSDSHGHEKPICKGLAQKKLVQEDRNNDEVKDDGNVGALHERLQRQLDLNCASEIDIVNELSRVRGVGTLSVNRIVMQRFVDGHFLDERDFDRRVRHMSLQRLRRLSHKAGLEIKVGMTDVSHVPDKETLSLNKKSGVAAREQNREKKCLSVNSVEVGQGKQNGDGESGNKIQVGPRWAWSEFSKMWNYVYSIDDKSERLRPITIASWNTARLSPHTATFWSKVGHILTFVEDSKADIVALQEVNSEGLGPLCRALTQATGDSWVLKHDAFGTTSDKSLALLIRTSTVTVRQMNEQWHHKATRDTRTSSSSKTTGNGMRRGTRTLTRVPQIYSVRAKQGRQTDQTVIFAHVHVSCSDTMLEMEVLGESLRRYNEGDGRDRIVVIIGDFNASATEKASGALRAAGFVELFSPLGMTVDGAFTTVSSSTTAAGRWLDNVWVRRDLRQSVCDAWCFDVASRRRSLTQSRRAYAAARRASHSDHLPLMVTLDMPG